MHHILLLRGINLGSQRRISMPELRVALDEAGYGPSQTYLQSGNLLLQADDAPEQLETAIAQLIEQRFAMKVPVVARSAHQIADIVARDPLGDVATDPKRYQVSFCAAEPEPALIDRLSAAVTGEERVLVSGREIYAWHPHGVARSKLWNTLGGTGLGMQVTTRNWTTVCALDALARQPAR